MRKTPGSHGMQSSSQELTFTLRAPHLPAAGPWHAKWLDNHKRMDRNVVLCKNRGTDIRRDRVEVRITVPSPQLAYNDEPLPAVHIYCERRARAGLQSDT